MTVSPSSGSPPDHIKSGFRGWKAAILSAGTGSEGALGALLSKKLKSEQEKLEVQRWGIVIRQFFPQHFCLCTVFQLETGIQGYLQGIGR